MGIMVSERSNITFSLAFMKTEGGPFEEEGIIGSRRRDGEESGE